MISEKLLGMDVLYDYTKFGDESFYTMNTLYGSQ